MSLDELLARPGLSPEVRLLVAASVAIWRGDWPTLRACAASARARSVPRTRFEEALLQAVLFCGFPRVVTAFEHLTEAWPTPSPPAGGALPLPEQAAAASKLFAAIYGKNTTAVDAMLRSYHADFHAFVLEVAYGRILTRPGLTAAVRETIAVAVLAAQDQVRQFAGHARGALALGASKDELRESVVTALGEEAAAAPWCARIR
ncbi:MAG: carboxymuconolactone decarboxylase family protein [Planctomycetota bacterium]